MIATFKEWVLQVRARENETCGGSLVQLSTKKSRSGSNDGSQDSEQEMEVDYD